MRSALRASKYSLFLLVIVLTVLATVWPSSTGAVAGARADQGTVTPRSGNADWVRTSGGAEAHRSRLIVGFRDGVGEKDRADVHQRIAARGVVPAARVAVSLGARAHVVETGGTVSPEQAAQEYMKDPRVRYAEPDYVMKAFEVPSDLYYSQQWDMQQISAADAWSMTRGSASVLVAILDTGIDESHPDLSGKVVNRVNFSASADSLDRRGHGTHVSGTVAANTGNSIGVAGVGYATRLLNVKVLADDGSGYNSSVINGIYWAANNGAKVINMSLGGPGPVSVSMQDAIDYAWNAGVVVVASAGNDGTSTPQSPAAGNHVVAVASTGSKDARSSFSNYGTWVSVAAPGESILSTYPGGRYSTMSGTSMAAPHVAGLAALVWATSYGTSAQAVVDRVKSTADPVGGTGTLWQSGRVNAARAVGQICAILTPTPTSTPVASPTPPTATATATPTSTPVASPTLPPTATPTSTPQPIAPPDTSAAERAALDTLNASRQAAGVAPLAPSSQLTTVAKSRAQQLASGRALTISIKNALKSLGIVNRSSESTGSAPGYQDAADGALAIERSMLSSKSQSQYLLGKTVRQVGIGVAAAGGSTYLVIDLIE